MQHKNNVVIGIDPGYDRLGWAVLSIEGKLKVHYIASGLITTDKKAQSSARLVELFHDLELILAEHVPRACVLEALFFSKNEKTAMQVSEARGVIQLALALNQVDIIEVHPKKVKKFLTGNGNSTKAQVEYMVEKLLAKHEVIAIDDVADAVAIGYVGALELSVQ